MINNIKKSFVLILTIAGVLTAASCQQASANNELKAVEFKQKMEAEKNKTLLDVRTPSEYADGHLAGATNIDWNGGNFGAEIAKLDKTKPVYVYCLAGSRSASAASVMRKNGFKQVYELQGGILKWRAAGLPEEGGATKAAGMTQQDFDGLLNTDKIVLVDFFATWCGPCKKMEPYLNEISKDMAATVNVARIDADIHSSLATQLHVDALPTVFIYKNKQLMWHHVGFVSKEDMIAKLKSIK
ncbi:hypothetical protein CAP35_01440 [Chitinophagaceae bacterium IBVUCB1]|nr:hypothetical protein CAP35_01440 [Chitinophagaceae bacterium IBVUCB1]